MPPLTREDALELRLIADGWPVSVAEDKLARWHKTGWVRLITPKDASAVRHHQDLDRDVEALRDQARRTERPGGLASVRLRLIPGARREARDSARALRNDADRRRDEAKEQWLGLSQRALVDIDLDLCAPHGDSFLQITDRGRAGVRKLLFSPEFDTRIAHDEAIPDRVARFLDLRAQLLSGGFQPDPRVDLAAALVSRHDSDPERLRALNRLASQERWVNYDRLPIMAQLCGLDGDAEAIWERFWAGYEFLRARGYPGEYETRLTVANLLRGGDVDDAACDRLWEIAKRLRLDGWSMSQSTDPVAGRLSALRLSPTLIASRVQSLFKQLERGASLRGPLFALAASVAADSNLHALSAKAQSAEVMEAVSPFTEFETRYDEGLALLPADPQQAPVTAFISVMLSRMPGTMAANVGRLQLVARGLAEHVFPPCAAPLSLLLIDAACPDWFDATRYVYEIGSLLPISEPTSIFTAFTRMSPMYSRGASAAEPAKPGGPASGP